jgi:hypothetical protein
MLVGALCVTNLNIAHSSSNPATVKLTVHYQRAAADYSGWELWLWRNKISGTDSDVNKSGVKFTGDDSYGKLVTLDISDMDKYDNLGIIVRKGEWLAKDLDIDRFIDRFNSDGSAEIWLLQGDPVVYYSKPSTKTTSPLSEEDKAAAEELAAEAAQDAKKLNITCVKGKTKKKITGDPPKCPSGYKNPLDAYLTFKAYSFCQLYKKDSRYWGVKLTDAGKTLSFDSVREDPVELSGGSFFDVECALTILKAPSFVKAQINSTRAIDGMRKATWGKISSYWTYHPNNGLDISFNTK